MRSVINLDWVDTITVSDNEIRINTRNAIKKSILEVVWNPINSAKVERNPGTNIATIMIKERNNHINAYLT